MKLKLLISPLSQGAYFEDYRAVAVQEFLAHFPHNSVELSHAGGLDFMEVCLDESDIDGVARLSFVQGIFNAEHPIGLIPLSPRPGFILPAALVDGWKYQGKTNERITQLAIHLGLRFCDTGKPPATLLDPMAGKGTTLLTGLRFGLNCTGVEQDFSALGALEGHLKKQTHLHRLKHSLSKGSIGRKSKGNKGKFVSCELSGHALKLVCGDTREVPELLAHQRFDVIVCDLPYGVQFTGSSRRTALETIQASSAGWVRSLQTGGTMVLLFNTYQPSRKDLADIFLSLNCRVHDFTIPHRMSESIVRDVLVIQHDK
jgi:hypothetical protein